MLTKVRMIALLLICIHSASCMSRVTISGAQPEQIHLSYGDDPTQMIISWSTMADVGDQAIVEYGIQNLNSVAHAQTFKFVDGGSQHRAQWVHYAVLNNIQPGAVYRYHVGGSDGWSSLYAFKAMQNGTNWSTTFAVYGDMGVLKGKALNYLQEEAQRGSIHGVLHVGDFAYDMFVDQGRRGDDFMNQIQPIAAYVPYMTCVGNHEVAYNFSHYKNRFNLARGQKNMFSSFNVASAHIISINTEVFMPEMKSVNIVPQYNWLVKDLQKAQAERHIRPWIIVMGHRPMYCSNNNDPISCNGPANPIRIGIDMKTHKYGFEDLFYKYGVNIQIYAHEHSYERLWPIYNFKMCNGTKGPYINPKGPVHIITGSAGNHGGQDPFNRKTYPWTAFRTHDFGYTRMTIANSTHIYFSQISTTQGGKVIDKFTVVREKPGAPEFDCI